MICHNFFLILFMLHIYSFVDVLIMIVYLRIQWNNGWRLLEVIWKQFQWSVALRPRLRQRVAQRESDDHSFQKLKSRIHDSSLESLIWLMLWLKSLWDLQALLMHVYLLSLWGNTFGTTLNSAYSNYDVIMMTLPASCKVQSFSSASSYLSLKLSNHSHWVINMSHFAWLIDD